MDITTLFKASVKTVRTRNKSFSNIPGGNGTVTPNDKKRILKRRNRSDFIANAKAILLQISRLRDFLLENRKAYLNFSNFVKDDNNMSDLERDQIDTGAHKVIHSCAQKIKELKQDSDQLSGSQQYADHRNAVLELIEAYLLTVNKIYTDQKNVRVKRASDLFKMSKIGSRNDSHNPFKIQNVTQNDDLRKPVTSHFETPVSNEDDELSPEEMQMFESENEQLYNELNNLDEEVQQMESKVVHISELQQVFTEKVLEQEKDIERIATTVVGATENLKDANDQIRQAIQRNAGLRVWVLFFLLVMSFSLLFLDWYND